MTPSTHTHAHTHTYIGIHSFALSPADRSVERFVTHMCVYRFSKQKDYDLAPTAIPGEAIPGTIASSWSSLSLSLLFRSFVSFLYGPLLLGVSKMMIVSLPVNIWTGEDITVDASVKYHMSGCFVCECVLLHFNPEPEVNVAA